MYDVGVGVVDYTLELRPRNGRYVYCRLPNTFSLIQKVGGLQVFKTPSAMYNGLHWHQILATRPSNSKPHQTVDAILRCAASAML